LVTIHLPGDCRRYCRVLEHRRPQKASVGRSKTAALSIKPAKGFANHGAALLFSGSTARYGVSSVCVAGTTDGVNASE
jgi:hypothetical protein